MLRIQLLITFILFNTIAFASNLNIAVASNFAEVAKKLVVQFEKQTGESVVISTASTAVLANQIKNGAPFVVLLAADELTPALLIKGGYAVSGTSFTYAKGQLVLWSKEPGVVDPKGQVLSDNKFKHLAIANPKLAPYGKSASMVINKMGLSQKLNNKIIQGDNIATTYQYVASGNAELGFVALSQIYDSDTGTIKNASAWIVPVTLVPLIKQDAVLTTYGKNDKTAKDFLRFLNSPDAKNIIKQFGYK